MIPITCSECGYTRQLREYPRLILGGLEVEFKTALPAIREDTGCPNCAMKDTIDN